MNNIDLLTGDLIKLSSGNLGFIHLWKNDYTGTVAFYTVPHDVVAMCLESNSRMVKVLYKDVIGFTYIDWVKEVYKSNE